MIRSCRVRFFLAIFLVCAVAGSALAGEFQRTFQFDSRELQVTNLIGEVQVVQTEGDLFLVTVDVRGADAEEGLLEFASEEGSRGRLGVVFPLKDHRKYVFPPLGADSKTTFNFHQDGEEGGSWLRRIFGGFSGEKVTVRGRGNGLEIWADLTIAVPRGRVLHVKQGVGTIGASGLEADLDLDINSGSIDSSDILGDYLADTGSGTVTVARIRGDVNIDTGSGAVDLQDTEGQKVLVDTGSGAVSARGIRCASLNIDTGSGAVTAHAIETDQANIDTGSGAVLLQLDRLGSGKYLIDTGSGSITLALPAGASAHISADTGSGSVNADVPGAQVKARDKGEIELTLGEGEARVILDAGSGSITIK